MQNSQCSERALAERRYLNTLFPGSQWKHIKVRARARLCVSGVGSGPSRSSFWRDSHLFLATSQLCGLSASFPGLCRSIAFTKPQTHNKPPKAFNSQGCFGRPVTCWRLPNGPYSVRAAETPGYREHSVPGPRGRKRDVEEARL